MGLTVFPIPAPAAPSYVGVGVSIDTTVSITSGVTNFFSWTTETFDTDNFWASSPNPSRIVIPSGKNGKYLFAGFLGIGGAGSNSFTLLLRKNGASNPVPGGILVLQPNNAGNTAADGFAVVLDLVATDYIELGVRLAATNTFTIQSALSATFLGA